MARRHPELNRTLFCMLKVLFSTLPLMRLGYFGGVFNVVRNPLESTGCFGVLIFILDVVAFRYLVVEELLARKPPLARNIWSAPDAGLYGLASVPLFVIIIVLFGAPVVEWVFCSKVCWV